MTGRYLPAPGPFPSSPPVTSQARTTGPTGGLDRPATPAAAPTRKARTMTEPVDAGAEGTAPEGTAAEGTADAGSPGPAGARFAGLDQRPVAEHVAVFEAEHDRLQRELGTIDQL